MSDIKTSVLNQDEFLKLNNWDRLNPEDFPFQSYEFHKALLDSQSIHHSSGQSFFVILAQLNNKILGALPVFIKYHSYGEYLFDWQWANHFQTNNVPYYPKLVAYSPFSPVIGPKFLMNIKEIEHTRFQIDDVRLSLLSKFKEFATSQNCFSASLLYPTPEEARFLASQDLAPVKKRINYQYNWQNQDYQNFEDFLSHLKKNKRKNIKNERQSIIKQGVQIRTIPLEELPDYGKIFYPFYLRTIEKKYAYAYLSEKFFKNLFSSLAEKILLFEAKIQDRIIAASLSLFNNQEVFGRYWGCFEEHRNLHFELCYYKNIEHAIKHKLKRVQAGAQGNHKIARGFLPQEVCSFHYFLHPIINDSIQSFIQEENLQMKSIKKDLDIMSPYKTKNHG